MFKEIYEAVKSDIVQSAGPQVREIDPTQYYLSANVDPDSPEDVCFIGGRPHRRAHRSFDLGTIAAIAKRFDAQSNCPVIWYSREAVTCLIDDEDRRDTVSCELTQSKEIERLQVMEATKPNLSQRDLRFMLRTCFKGALGAHPNFIEAIENVRWESQAATDSNLKRGKSSVGESLRQEVTGIKGVEQYDYITLAVPVFTNTFARARRDVVCVFEINEKEQTFQLFPVPGAVEGAFAESEEDILAQLTSLLGDAGLLIPVYYGASE